MSFCNCSVVSRHWLSHRFCFRCLEMGCELYFIHMFAESSVRRFIFEHAFALYRYLHGSSLNIRSLCSSKASRPSPALRTPVMMYILNRKHMFPSGEFLSFRRNSLPRRSFICRRANRKLQQLPSNKWKITYRVSI